jgi:hypothetical protein
VTTLTDRYVADTLRSVPEKSRGEIERELRSSIDDAMEARLGRGESREAAEVAVLTDLGDPAKLAAAYSGPPRYLIGPNSYHYYVRTLKVVLALLVPGSWALLLSVWVAGGSSFGNALITASAGALLVALLAVFWTTVGYAVVDCSEEARREVAAAFGATQGTWTPDRLPVSSSLRPIRVNVAVEAIVSGIVGITVVLAQRSLSPFSDAAGHAIPFINPDAWSFWMPAAIVIMIAWIVAEFVMLARGAWSPLGALAITACVTAYGGVSIYLMATGQIFNAAFFEKFGAAPWIAPGSISVAILILLTLIDSVTRIAKAWGLPIGNGRS